MMIIMMMMIIIITTINLRTKVYDKIAVLCKSFPHSMCMKEIYEMAKRIYAKPFAVRKMIPVNLSLRYSNIKVTVTYKLQRANVERSECVRLDSGGECLRDCSTGTIWH